MGVSHVSYSQRGFTLTEVAIVFGVIGILLGAIWVAASSVSQNQHSTQATKQIMIIVQNIRSLYASQSGFSASEIAAGYITTELVGAGVFPSDMGIIVSAGNSTPLNPWGGNTNILIDSSNPATYWVEYSGVPQSACIGLMSAAVNSGALSICNANCAAIISPANFTPSWAVANCTNEGSVEFQFSLQ